MKAITWHGVLQVLMTAGQILNVVVAVVPTTYKPYVAVAIGFIQVILHQYATNQPPPIVQ